MVKKKLILLSILLLVSLAFFQGRVEPACADSWVSLTNSEDGGWSNNANAYDDDTATYAISDILDTKSWSTAISYYYYPNTTTEVKSTKVRFWAYCANEQSADMQVWIFNGSSGSNDGEGTGWTLVLDGTDYNYNEWTEKNYSECYVRGIRLRVYNPSSMYTRRARIKELDIYGTAEETGWVRPDNFSDPQAGWNDETEVYDGQDAGMHERYAWSDTLTREGEGGDTSEWIHYNWTTPMQASHLRCFCPHPVDVVDGSGDMWLDYKNSTGDWVALKSGEKFTLDRFMVFQLSGNPTVSAVKFRFKNTDDSYERRGHIRHLGLILKDSSQYYFSFNHSDKDGGDVDSLVSWQLHNASGQISYTDGEATLPSGTYTLKTYYHGHLINETFLATGAYGNSTVDLTMQMKPHSHTAGGYIASNTSITSVTVHQQTSINLTFTITASTPCLLIIDVGGPPDNITKDGSPFLDYTYTASPAKHVWMERSSLSTFSFFWDSPPEQEGGQESSGASGGQPWRNRLSVTVLYEGEVLHLANVSVEGMKEVIWGLTNIFGEIKFFLPKGSFTVEASHEDYGSASRDILLEDDLEVEIDIAKGNPLTVFPSIDFGELEMSVLILPLLIFVIYAFSLALRKPKRKYRYSYLG